MLIHNMLVGMIDVVVHADVVEIKVVGQVSTLNYKVLSALSMFIH